MAVSNDVLEEKYNNMKEQNEKDHKRMFKYMDDIKNIVNSFITSADKKYATKEEVESIKGSLTLDKKLRNNTKLEWAKSRGAILVALITVLGTVAVSIFK